MPDNYSIKGKQVLIMGGGKFGTRALTYFKNKCAKVLVVDLNSNCIASSHVDIESDDIRVYDSLKPGQSAFLAGNAVHLLDEMIICTKIPNLIVTSIPGNAIAKVCSIWLSKRGIILEPKKEAIPALLQNIPESLVSFVDQDSASIVVSYMPFGISCKENCFPPDNMCAKTGRPKICSMDKLLEFAVYDIVDVSCILLSRQLTSGLGAIQGKDLISKLNRIGQIKSDSTLALGTACDCHGILNLFKTKK
jgi:hypothetical protein